MSEIDDHARLAIEFLPDEKKIDLWLVQQPTQPIKTTPTSSLEPNSDELMHDLIVAHWRNEDALDPDSIIDPTSVQPIS
jgi:hypothetical protein